MSAYGKSQPPSLHAFDSTRSFPESSYPFVQPAYGSQASVTSSTPAPVYHTAAQMAFPSNQGRGAYDDQSGPYLNVGSTPIPQLLSYAPASGSRGTKVIVTITSLYELQTTNTPMFFLLFGRQKCVASLLKTSQNGAVCQYQVSAEVPQFAATGWSSAQVHILMYMETGDGDVIAKVDVGDFTYVDANNPTSQHPSQDISRKRKISSDSTELMKSPVTKRIASGQQIRPKEEYTGYSYTPTDGTTPYSPYLQPGSSYNNLLPQYTRAAAGYQGQAQAQVSARHMGYAYSSSTAASPPTIKAQSPQIPNWNPSYSTVGTGLVRSPGVPSNSVQSRTSLSSMSSPSVTVNPPLIRTSTLQQTPSPATTPHGAHPGQHFNAYALYPHKAKLEINGDLDAMALNWSEEEWESKRRLVLFRRSQSGSTITTNFQPVAVDDRPPHSVCISCIYWEEKNECFVTSVDTIQLLEHLVAARFTVEEKNRIRRNLEGFRPLTVSKGKSDSEEFFKVIMAFPTPKPRNIEKDVKVFHWKDLSSALKKIISKYSASPSSTLPPAPALLTPVSATGYATDSGAGVSYVSDHHGAVSPPSISGSTTSTAYSTSIPARVMSPLGQKSMTSLQSGPSDLRVSVPHPHEGSGHWPGGQHHMPTPQQYQQLGNQSARNSWDMSSYLDSSPATAGGTSNPQALNYANTRNVNVADSAIPGGDNRMVRSLSGQHQQSHQMPRT